MTRPRTALFATLVVAPLLAGCMGAPGPDEAPATPSPPAVRDDWPMARGGPGRTGVRGDPEGGTGEVLWRFDAGLTPFARGNATRPVVVADGGTQVRALDPAEGRARWSFDAGPVSTPVVASEGLVHFGAWNTQLHALNASTGAPVWSFQMAYWALSAPAVADGAVLAADFTGHVYLLDAATGRPRWNASLHEQVEAPALLAGGRAIVAGASRLVAFDAASGARAWEAAVPGGVNLTSAAVAGGLVLAGSEDGALHAFDAATGAGRWTRAVGARNGYGPHADASVAIVATEVGDLLLLDPASGEERGSVRLAELERRGPERPGIAVAGGAAFVLAERAVVAVDLATRQVRWRTAHGAGATAELAVQDGQVYLLGGAGYREGLVQAFDAATGAALWRRRDRVGVDETLAAGAGLVLLTTTEQPSVLHALDASTGRARWSFPLEGPTLAAPVVRGGRVFVAMGNHTTLALDAASDHVAWRAFTPENHGGEPAVSTDTLFVAGSYLAAHHAGNGTARWVKQVHLGAMPGLLPIGDLVLALRGAELVAHDAASGALRWEHDLGSRARGPPATDGTRAYVATDGLRGRGTLVGLDAGTGDVELRVDDVDVAYGLSVDGGMVFAATGRGLVAIDAATGNVTAMFNATGTPVGPPAVAPRAVFAALADQRVVALRADLGAVLWEAALDARPRGAPVVADGRLFVPLADGVAALDAGADRGGSRAS